MTSSTQTRDL